MLIVGNWKMHKTGAQAADFVQRVAPEVGDRQVWLAVPFTALHAVANEKILIGGQNLHEAESGAFTGEISAGMLVEAGAKFVLVGHSERRHVFGESDAQIAKKLEAARGVGLQPIFCIGETLEEREAGQTEAVLRRQLEGIDSTDLIVAYEPVWAIGTGQTATPEMAHRVHEFVKGIADVPVLYGGSVKPDNAGELMAQGHIDGVLVGGASLEVESFLKIVRV